MKHGNDGFGELAKGVRKDSRKIYSSQRVPSPSRVFLGARVSDSTKDAFKAILHGKDVEIRQMMIAENTFTLTSQAL